MSPTGTTQTQSTILLRSAPAASPCSPHTELDYKSLDAQFTDLYDHLNDEVGEQMSTYLEKFPEVKVSNSLD